MRPQREPPPVGNTAKPPFLDRWGVIFVACAGGWVLAVSLSILIYYLCSQPQLPSMNNLTPEQIKEALNVHKELRTQWTESLTMIFDLLVTRTVLPIVTLLLGYLFGRRKD